MTISSNTQILKELSFADAKSARHAFEKAKLDQKSYFQITYVVLKHDKKIVYQNHYKPPSPELKSPLKSRIAHYPDGVDLQQHFDLIFGNDE